MPEEKKAAEKTEKAKKNAQPGKLDKVFQWFKTLPQRIAKPFKNMYYELKKVTWPTKQKLINYSIIVLAFMLVMGVVIGLLDMGASAGVRLLIPKSSTSTVTSTASEEDLEEAEDAEDAVEEAAEEAAEEAEGTLEAAEEAAETAAEEAAETAEDAAEAVTEEAAEAVEEAAEAAAEEAAEAVEEAAEEATESTEEAASGEK